MSLTDSTAPGVALLHWIADRGSVREHMVCLKYVLVTSLGELYLPAGVWLGPPISQNSADLFPRTFPATASQLLEIHKLKNQSVD